MMELASNPRGRLAVQSRLYQSIDQVHPIARSVRWAFYLFLASLPFEAVNFGGSLELTMITGGLLVFSTIFQIRLFYRWPSGAFWCFIVYLYICFVMSLMEAAKHRQELAWELLVLTQLIFFCWLSYNLMLFSDVAKTGLVWLAGACATLATLQVLGITATASDVGAKIERVTALGGNPNETARILVAGLLALIGLTYGQTKSFFRLRYVGWPIIAILGISIVQTGSRGALIALGAGLMVFVLRRGSLWHKVRNSFGILLLVGFFTFISFESQTTRARFERALEEGDLARREEVYPNAIRMFVEKPLVGWGTVGYTYELGSRLGHISEESKNSHNLILHALVATGLLGAVPLIAGLGLAVRNAWLARQGAQGILPLAMMMALLVVNMSGLWLYKKLHWILIAYALAGSGRLVNNFKRC
jgi:O-antigen ligase